MISHDCGHGVTPHHDQLWLFMLILNIAFMIMGIEIEIDITRNCDCGNDL